MYGLGKQTLTVMTSTKESPPQQLKRVVGLPGAVV
ncbi:MAG: hypothetical protein ACI92S_003452, partial [Planctomycetaceae bacterium]